MRKVVQVRTSELEKIFPADVCRLCLAAGDTCIVESEQRLQFGEVLSEPELILETEVPKTLKLILRKASRDDIKQREENKKKEREAFQICLRKIEEKNLPMKLVAAKVSFDRTKITFCFTADGRVDFRELIKDLARVFRTRIEMRQIGVRDEAKMLGGIGCCGRTLCCASFLKSFEPVGIRMARNQGLPLNPDKILGLCGRLMCCLAFENKNYVQARKELPKEGTQVSTEKGIGKVVSVKILKKLVVVELEDGQELELPASKIARRWWGGHRSKT